MRQVLPIAAAVVIEALVIVGRASAGVSTVPEPATLTLLGAGAAVFALGAWWRNRK